MAFLKGYAAFLKYRYWIDLHPVPLGPSLVGAILSFFAWFIIIGVALAVVRHGFRKKRPPLAELLRRFAGMLGTTGFLGLLFLFFAYEQLPILGMRFWFLLLFILFAVWLGRCAFFAVRDFPEMQQALDEKRRLAKYLPNSKKR